jgi:hypothetical protein
MEFVIGEVSGLMDVRFAAAAGTERVVLNPWIIQVPPDSASDLQDKAASDSGALQKTILRQALAVWSEIKSWVAGPEIWLAAPLPHLTMSVEAFESMEDCCGIMVTHAPPNALKEPQHISIQIPPHIPYAIDYLDSGSDVADSWSAVHPPQWVILSLQSLVSLNPMPAGWGNCAKYVFVRTIEEVHALLALRDLPAPVGIYLRTIPGEDSDYEAWQKMIDAVMD